MTMTIRTRPSHPSAASAAPMTPAIARMASRATPVLALLLALSACTTTPAPVVETAPPLTTASPQEMVAMIRAAEGDGEGELAVRPLRDSMVEDLREQAERAEQQGDVTAAARALDQALEIAPEDPALLQERAEIALLQQQPAQAASLAERAYALGAQVGPLCRRHWTTLEQVRLLERNAEGAAAARAQIEACKVEGPARY